MRLPSRSRRDISALQAGSDGLPQEMGSTPVHGNIRSIRPSLPSPSQLDTSFSVTVVTQAGLGFNACTDKFRKNLQRLWRSPSWIHKRHNPLELVPTRKHEQAWTRYLKPCAPEDCPKSYQVMCADDQCEAKFFYDEIAWLHVRECHLRSSDWGEENQQQLRSMYLARQSAKPCSKSKGPFHVFQVHLSHGTE